MIFIDLVVQEKQVKPKSPKKKVSKNKKKLFNKEVVVYTQADLLKSRKKVLSKMSLHEALYKGITGKPRKTPEGSPEQKNEQVISKPLVRIRRSPIKTARNITTKGAFSS